MTTVTFDDISFLPDNYDGILWGNGWGIDHNDPNYRNELSPNSVYNPSSQPTFSFAAPVEFQGAWFGGPINLTVTLFLHGMQVAQENTTQLFPGTTGPNGHQFLSFPSVLADEVQITGVPPGGFFVMDDVTFTQQPMSGVVSVSDTTDPTSASVTKNQTVTPFAHLNVSDTVPTETISAQVTVSSGYSTSSSTTITGTAAQVQSALDGFTARALTKGPGKITVAVSDPNLSGAGAGKVVGSFTFNGTSPGGSGLVSPTADQITTLTNDTIQFYSDQKSGASTAGDATNMVNDLTGLSIDKPTLAQLLTAALQGDAPTNADKLGSYLANVFYGSINGDTHSQSSALSGDLTSTIKETVAVGGTYNGLAATELAATALAQTVSQYHLSG